MSAGSENLPFDLPFLPPSVDLRHPDLLEKAAVARTELGELKGYAISLPNPLLLLSPAIIKESLASSEIENVNTTVEKVFQNSLFPESEQSENDKEVLRYREAILVGYSEMRKLPLSGRLIEIVQNALMRGKQGGFRTSQNYIKNSHTNQIIYTPPSAEKLPGLIADLEKFMHEQDRIDPLIKCAILHYQFEAIHPFMDGNGRTGRILMVLYLVSAGMLSLPILYISGYINRNRAEYYNLLHLVTAEGRWSEYIGFILDGLALQAAETKSVFFQIRELHQEFKNEIREKLPKVYSPDLVEHLFATPILSPTALAEKMQCHYTTATRYLDKLLGEGFLADLKHGRYHLYVNTRLMAIIAA